MPVMAAHKHIIFIFEGRTSELLFSPIKLPVTELAVAAKAFTKTNGKEDKLLTILDIASSLSPKCSIAIKNKNQVATETNCCNIVQIETSKTDLYNGITSLWESYKIDFLKIK